jgi:phage repressor protein C with HTH and peptisase S24 domain
MVDLPRLSLGASAGAGSLDQDEQIVDVVAFDRHWLRRMGFELGSITMIRVDGESMAPTLYDGDEILVDTSDTAARLRDGIYVLRLDGVLMVKRIVIGPRRGSLSILSDNPHYPDWTEIEPALVHIVGRVLWVGRALQ